jgi:transposase, IS5 family
VLEKAKSITFMQKQIAQTQKMLLSTEAEIFEKTVAADHPFRQLEQLVNFTELVEPLRGFYQTLGRTGFDVEKGFRALIVQFWEDLSDRQMENAVKGTMAVRWFCKFSLDEETADHTYFCKLRKRLGTKRIADIFKQLNKILEGYGMFGNVFTFIDASAIVTKKALWKERDKAIAEGQETLNNLNIKQYAKDKDARWGAKSKSKIWFGYKRHNAVDMRHGIITKVAVTPANVPDYQMVGSIVPEQGAVFMDKLYDCTIADREIQATGCHAVTIRKKNNKNKNRDLDRWRSSVRMPFEGVFSKTRKRAKFRGLEKVTMQCFFEAISHNLKKAVTVLPTKMVPIQA